MGDNESIGQRLRSAREGAGLSLSNMSMRAHFSVGHLSNVERGIRAPTSDVVLAYERVVGKDVVWRAPSAEADLPTSSSAPSEIDFDVDIAARIRDLGKSVDVDLVRQIHETTTTFIESYESLSHSAVTPVLIRAPA